jgi:DNA modification methylase
MKMSIKILQGNCLKTLSSLEEKSVNTCVTSPPYWGLRDYGNGDQLGQEETPEKFVDSLVNVFREVRRVLRDDGTVWLNLGDSYNVVRRSRHIRENDRCPIEAADGQKGQGNNKVQRH